jgi:RNA polymerase sigma-70 factor (ECF subfamily)
MVYSVAASRVSVDDAADVVQEVFLRALRKLKALRSAPAFAGWISAIARNAARDFERQERSRLEVVHEPTKRETQHHEMDARAALGAIRALPAAYRDTMTMRLVHGMTGPEIASRTGLSAASVRVNLHRGMKLLRQRLARPARKKRA